MDEVKHEINSPEDVAVASLIVLTRIYDVLMADLKIRNPLQADAILAAHARGVLLAPPPAYVEDV